MQYQYQAIFVKVREKLAISSLNTFLSIQWALAMSCNTTRIVKALSFLEDTTANKVTDEINQVYRMILAFYHSIKE